MSVGLSLLNMTKDEYIKLIDEQTERIEYIYYSPNINTMFSRTSSPDDIIKLKEKNMEQYEVLNYARSKGIKTELAINTVKTLCYRDLHDILEIEKVMHYPDRIITYNSYVDTCYEVFPESNFSLSYNQMILNSNLLNSINKKFDSLVVGNKQIRNIPFMNKIKETGLKIIVATCLGCVPTCHGCFYDEKCAEHFNKFIENDSISLNKKFTISSVDYYDIRKLNELGLIDMIKISNRPETLTTTTNMMNIYSGSDVHNLSELEYLKCINTLGHWQPILEKLDLTIINKERESLWK